MNPIESARADEDIKNQAPLGSSISPGPATLFKIAEQDPLTLPQSEVRRINEQIFENSKGKAPTAVVMREVLYLMHGLYLKVEAEIDRVGINQVMQQVSEKRDMTSIKFEANGIGKAELKALGRGNNIRPFTTIRHNSGHYFIFVDRFQFNPGDLLNYSPSPNDSKDEAQLDLAIRETMLASVRMITAQKLLDQNPKDYRSVSALKEGLDLAGLTESKALESHHQRYNEILRTLLDPSISKETQEHLNQELARIESEFFQLQTLTLQNSGRPNSREEVPDQVLSFGKQPAFNGYEVTVIMHNLGQSIDSISTQRTPSKMSLLWWKTYWEAIREPAHVRWDLLKSPKILNKVKFFGKGDIALCLNSVGMQIASGLVLFAAVNWALLHGYTTRGSPHTNVFILNTLFWGGVIGYNNRTYSNWLRIGSDNSRDNKDTGTGVGYAYTQLFFEMILNGAGAISFVQHLQIWTTQYLKKFVKNGQLDIPMHRARTGESAGDLKILEFNTEIRKAEFELQLLQWIGFPSKLAALFLDPTFGIPLYMMMGPLGKAYYVKMIEKFADKYEEKFGANTDQAKFYRKEAIDGRKEWENMRLIKLEKVEASFAKAADKIHGYALLIEKKSDPTRSDRTKVALLKWTTKETRAWGRAVHDTFNPILEGVPFLEFLISRFPGYYVVLLPQASVKVKQTWAKIQEMTEDYTAKKGQAVYDFTVRSKLVVSKANLEAAWTNFSFWIADEMKAARNDQKNKLGPMEPTIDLNHTAWVTRPVLISQQVIQPGQEKNLRLVGMIEIPSVPTSQKSSMKATRCFELSPAYR